MTQVAKPFRDFINEDVLVWLNLVVENPLSSRFTDEMLLNIASKARGRLQTLALLNGFKITDEGLLKVVTANPLLTKLYVPGCTGLTPEGVFRAVKTLTAKPTTTFSTLKINGIYNIKIEDLQILQSCITQTTNRKPRFYHKYRSSSFHSINEDVRSIDVEMCPICEEVKLVFDCPYETKCVGCSKCIPRCEVCGKCVSDKDEDEQGDTVCNNIVCPDCWLRLPKCNHCNKPFCPRHAQEQLAHPGSQGFVCEVCHTKSLAHNSLE